MRIIKGTPKPRVSTEVRCFAWSLLQAQVDLLHETTWRHGGPSQEEVHVIQSYLDRLLRLGLNEPDMLRLCRTAVDISGQVMDRLQKEEEAEPAFPFHVIDGGDGE